MSLQKIFAYKLLTFLGDEDDANEFRIHAGNPYLIHNNLIAIANEFAHYCEMHNSDKEYLILKIGPKATLGFVWNSSNHNNPYIMIYDRTVEKDDNIEYASKMRMYSIKLTEVPILTQTTIAHHFHCALPAMIKFSQNIMKQNPLDIWMLKDLQNFADTIDKYPTMAQKYHNNHDDYDDR